MNIQTLKHQGMTQSILRFIWVTLYAWMFVSSASIQAHTEPYEPHHPTEDDIAGIELPKQLPSFKVSDVFDFKSFPVNAEANAHWPVFDFNNRDNKPASLEAHFSSCFEFVSINKEFLFKYLHNQSQLAS